MNNLTTGKRIAIAALAAVGVFIAGWVSFWLGGGELFTMEAGWTSGAVFVFSAIAVCVSFSWK